MSTHTPAPIAVTPLPEGHDVKGSFWYVRPEHRADYVSLSTADLPHRERKDLRRQLASILYDDALKTWRADTLADYMRRHNVNEYQALKYIGDLSGRVAVGVDTSQQLHERFDVGGSEWPSDAEPRVEHLWRLQRSKWLADSRAKASDYAASNRCPMCHDVAPAHLPALRVTRRTPAPGVPPVNICGVCEAAIAHVHSERATNAVVVDGKSRRDLATEYLDAHNTKGTPSVPAGSLAVHAHR
ncbi:hypothetical protein G4H71_13290 [Rhodococcus triatomae]|nr:hypothetical protein [Rhodococcus triatomae]QNG20217.1 hypothetical protein G4H72_17090 [Rhodococcus triatomae]QNG23868.1 hypothetical protein G4H71_13290 [Rhodococcus triatomae]